MKRALGITLLALLAAGLSGCAGGDVEAEPVELPVQESSIAYDYFGSVQVAKGSRINMRIDKVASSSDITVVNAPNGVVASIVDDDDGTTRLELVVTDEADAGPQTVTFDIAGEPEPVTWTVQITG